MSLKAYCKGETLCSVCIRATWLYFHTHVAEKAAFPITCCFGRFCHSHIWRVPASSNSALVESDSSLSLLPHWCAWVALWVLMCSQRGQKCEVWEWMANHSSFTECVSLQMQYILSRAWGPWCGVYWMMMITWRPGLFAPRGWHSPAACLLCILLDYELAAPCFSVHTTMLWDKDCLMFFFC